MHSSPSKHGIHKISSPSGTYGNNLHVCLTLDFLVIFPNARYAIRDGDRSQTATASKCELSNARHAVRDSNSFKAATVVKCGIINALHAVRDGDGGQLTATLESAFSNARHAVRDGD